jgi:hypothetical protein
MTYLCRRITAGCLGRRRRHGTIHDSLYNACSVTSEALNHRGKRAPSHWLVSRIGLAVLSRAEIKEDTRQDFHVCLDEFQNFTILSLVNKHSLTTTPCCAAQTLDNWLSTDRNQDSGALGYISAAKIPHPSCLIEAHLFDFEMFIPKIAIGVLEQGNRS